MTSGSVVGYAVVLGMIALLNPCGFPLLPVYLTAFVGERDRAWWPRVLSGLRAGLAVTAGFLAVFTVAGVLTGTVHVVLVAVAPWALFPIGAGVFVFGVFAVAGRTLPVRVSSRFRAGRSLLAMTGFGAAYALGSLSCSLPVFVVAVGGAFATGSPVLVIAVVVAFGLGMGLLAMMLAVVVAVVDAAAFRSLRRVATVVPRVAGMLCILVGLYLVGYAVGQVGGPDLVAPVTGLVDTVQARLVSAFEAAWLPIGIVLAAATLTVLVAAAQRRIHPRPHPPLRDKEPS